MESLFDTFCSILMAIPILIIFACTMWWAMVSVGWYLFLIPAYIGGGISLYRKNAKPLLIGLAVSWIGSWIIAFVSVFFIKF